MTITEGVQQKTDELVAELADIDDQVAKLTSRKEEIKRTLAALLPEGKHAAVGGRSSVSVTIPRRFNAEKFAAAYPPETHLNCYDVKPSASKVKAILGADVYEACRVAGDAQVTVK